MDKKKILNNIAKNFIDELKEQDIQKIKSVDDVKQIAIKIGRNVISKGVSKYLSVESENHDSEEDDVVDKNDSELMDDVETECVLSDEDNNCQSDEGEDFLDTMTSTMSTPITRPQDVLATIAIVAQSANEAIKFTETEETKREEIRAERDVAIANIASMKECLMDYLDKSFDERKANFGKLFDTVEKAVEKNDINALSLALNSINELAASSPFKALSDVGQVKQLLADKNSELDI